MLVLSRRIDQQILIGDNISVMVTDIQDGKVQLGIEAPPDVVILREEVAKRAGPTDSGQPRR